MKIRLFILLFSSLIFLSKYACAQTNEFAPVGAKWWYGFDGFPPEIPSGYFSIECIKDTIKNDIPCKYLKSFSIIDNIVSENNDFFLYQNEDTVFYLVDSLMGEVLDSTFNVLYIFNTTVGAFWDIGYGDYTGPILDFFCSDDSLNFLIIDSVNVETINDIELKRIFYHNDFSSTESNWVMEGDAYEIFGSTKYLLPLPILCFVEDYFPNKLRCYEDKNIGLVKFVEGGNCEIISNITNNISPFEIQFINNGIQINGTDQDYFVNIFNLQGQLIYSEYCNTSKFIDLSKFSENLYICKINSKTYSFTSKINLL